MESKQDTIKKALQTIAGGFSELLTALQQDDSPAPYTKEEELDESNWVDLGLAAELLDCSRLTVRNRAADGIIERKIFGARWKYYRPSIEEYLKANNNRMPRRARKTPDGFGTHK